MWHPGITVEHQGQQELVKYYASRSWRQVSVASFSVANFSG
jgi:hypothetical protein